MCSQLSFNTLTIGFNLQERAKSQLTKVVVESLVNALKFRIYLPDENLLKTLQVTPII